MTSFLDTLPSSDRLLMDRMQVIKKNVAKASAAAEVVVVDINSYIIYLHLPAYTHIDVCICVFIYVILNRTLLHMSKYKLSKTILNIYQKLNPI